jgi:hypothetical protein
MTKMIGLLLPLLLFGGCLGTGCTVRLLNQGEVGFAISTEWKLIHRAAQTAPQPSESGVDFPALEDWIRSKPSETVITDDAPTPVPD